MDKVELLTQIFKLCIFPLLGILTTYFIQIIRVKMDQIIDKQDNELFKKYLDMLTNTITNCVVAVNQTYVDTLKKRGEFTSEAQKEAFEMVYKQVIATLTQEAREYLSEVYGDLDNFIKILIEAKVRENKLEI